MFVRLVRARVRDGELENLHQEYDAHIIPQLRTVPGCLYAGLLHNARSPEECISMTLWKSRPEAESYAQSPLFAALMERIKPFLADSSEQRLQLSADLRLEYVQVEEKPIVEQYSVEAQSGTQSHETAGQCIRIVLLRVADGKVEEFKEIYRNSVVSTLRSVRGCSHIFLMQSAGKTNEFISVTLWENEELADMFTHGELFRLLIGWMKHTLPPLYQWKMEQDVDGGKTITTSEDVVIEHYNVLTTSGFLSPLG